MSVADNAKVAMDVGDHAQGWLRADLPTGVIVIFLLLFILVLLLLVWTMGARVRDSKNLAIALNATLERVNAANADMAKTMALALQRVEMKLDQALAQGVRRRPPGEHEK